MIFLIWVVTLAPLPWPVTPVMGATFNVNTTADTIDVNPGDGTCADSSGNCSLRAAIQEANAQAGADTIVLQSGQTYTLSLDGTAGNEDSAAEDDLDITSQITIVGNGATIQRSTGMDFGCNLDGTTNQFEFRIFDVLSGGNLTLQNVTVTNGCADGGSLDEDGGGIRNIATVTIQSSTISNNRARGFGGGISNDVTVTITNSTISNNSALNGDGGGIDNDGTVTLTNSTISNNSAGDDGGGIDNFGTATITNSTISGNSAVDVGGGIDIAGGTVTLTNSTISGNSAGNDGGGIDNSGTVTLTNSTISGNSTGGASGDDGGGIWNNGTVNASFVTIANNSAGASGQGGGIFNDTSGTVNIKNSIVGNNTAGGGGPNCSGGVTATGTNLATDNTCTGFTQVASTGAGGLNLGPLANNGGPTQTHALLAGSAAIDAVTTCTNLSGNSVTTDQRGLANVRTLEAPCDVGAYEARLLTLRDDGSARCLEVERDSRTYAFNTVTSGILFGAAQVRTRGTTELIQNIGGNPLRGMTILTRLGVRTGAASLSVPSLRRVVTIRDGNLANTPHGCF